MTIKDTNNPRARAHDQYIQYSEELFDEILDRIAEGESMIKICQEEGMPVRKTIFRWIAEKEGAEEKYRLAIRLRTDKHAEELIAISDDVSLDEVEVEITPGVKVIQKNPEAIQRSKLKVDTRKWLMSKMEPKKYGDITKIQHAGHDGGELGGTWIVKGVSPGDVVPIPEEDKDE